MCALANFFVLSTTVPPVGFDNLLSRADTLNVGVEENATKDNKCFQAFSHIERHAN